MHYSPYVVGEERGSVPGSVSAKATQPFPHEAGIGNLTALFSPLMNSWRTENVLGQSL